MLFLPLWTTELVFLYIYIFAAAPPRFDGRIPFRHIFENAQDSYCYFLYFEGALRRKSWDTGGSNKISFPLFSRLMKLAPVTAFMAQDIMIPLRLLILVSPCT